MDVEKRIAWLLTNNASRECLQIRKAHDPRSAMAGDKQCRCTSGCGTHSLDLTQQLIAAVVVASDYTQTRFTRAKDRTSRLATGFFWFNVLVFSWATLGLSPEGIEYRKMVS